MWDDRLEVATMNLEPWALTIIFGLAGFTLKLADHTGERSRGAAPFAVAGICGLIFGALVSESGFSSAIVLGIIIGVGLSKKIDRKNLVFGLAMTAFSALLLGPELPIAWLLVVVTLSSLLDEYSHDRLAVKSGVGIIFRYRPILKAAIVVSTVVSALPWVYAVAFLLFDLSYDATGALMERTA